MDLAIILWIKIILNPYFNRKKIKLKKIKLRLQRLGKISNFYKTRH